MFTIDWFYCNVNVFGMKFLPCYATDMNGLERGTVTDLINLMLP